MRLHTTPITLARPLQLISAILFLCFSSHVSAEELKSGSYTLELDIPAMAEGTRKTELKGELKSGNDGFTFETKGAMGNRVTMHGKLAGDRVAMWVTQAEHSNLVTFHYTGQLSEEEGVSATGELSLFTRHEKAATGTWTLRLKEIMVIPQEPDFPRAQLEAVVAQLRAKSMEPGRVHRFRLSRFPSPSSLGPLKDDEHLNRGEGRGLVWAEVSTKGVLKVAIETRDSGHAGESGFLYSDTPVTTADIDELGREWKLGRRISEHWWMIIYDLG